MLSASECLILCRFRPCVSLRRSPNVFDHASPSFRLQASDPCLSVQPLSSGSESQSNDRRREPDCPTSSLEFLLVCRSMLRYLKREAFERLRVTPRMGRHPLSPGPTESVPESHGYARRQKGNHSYSHVRSWWNECNQSLALRNWLRRFAEGRTTG